MDLMYPMRTKSLGGKKYILVMVDDYSRYAWVAFRRDKSEAFINFKDTGLKIQNAKGHPIEKIRSDKGRKFDNSDFLEFFHSLGIKHGFPLLEHLNKMGLLKERIVSFEKWPEQC